jgi:hypothetical protein
MQELEDLRQQAQIWCDSHHSEGDKLKAEVELLNGQLLQRSNELSSMREQLTEARAERDRALQERQQVRPSCPGMGVTIWLHLAAATKLAELNAGRWALRCAHIVTWQHAADCWWQQSQQTQAVASQ